MSARFGPQSTAFYSWANNYCCFIHYRDVSTARPSRSTTPSSSINYLGVEIETGERVRPVTTRPRNVNDQTGFDSDREADTPPLQRPRPRRVVRGLPVGTPIFLAFLLLGLLTSGESVTCFTCFDGIPGCEGGESCPFLTLTASNRAIVTNTVGDGEPTALSCTGILPLRHLRVLTRTTLDVLKVVARRPVAGTPVDIVGLDHEGLIAAVNAGSVYLAEALREIARRIAAATTQIELSRLNGLQTTLSSIERVGASLGGAGASNAAGVLLGALTYTYYKATAIVRSDMTTAVTGVVTEDLNGMSVDDRRLSTSVVSTRIHLPRSFTDFSNALMIWVMIATATGLAHVLSLGNFIQDTVYDTISKLKRPWQVAHELFLIYLEKIEVCDDASLNIANVFNGGGQDTLLARAEDQAKRTFGEGIFRPVRERDGRPEEGGGSKPEWTGSFNRDPNARPCISFNLGKRHHPASALNDKGGCRFNHICDAWVVKDGKRQMCGSSKHHRLACDNPNREAKEAS